LFNTRKYIRYSQNKKTEDRSAYLLLFKNERIHPLHSGECSAGGNLYIRQIGTIREKLSSIHEDLKYDYELELKKL